MYTYTTFSLTCYKKSTNMSISQDIKSKYVKDINSRSHILNGNHSVTGLVD